MSEPIATPICTYALVTAGAACTVFGLDAEALVWGFAGGLIAQTYIPAVKEDGTPVKPLRAFVMLAGGAVMASAFVPFAANILTKIGIADGVGYHAIKVAAAVVLGIIAPSLPPLLRRFTNKTGA